MKRNNEPTAHDVRLLRGPEGLLRDMRRCLHILGEFARGFWSLRGLSRCVTVFGSARFREGHPYYELARETARHLAHSGVTVMTGGGPGIMEAANRGAREGDGLSIGCNIRLPHEQAPNPYLDRWVEFDHFFVRKVMLVKDSSAFVLMPGGFGTLDEIFETLTLIQTRKVGAFPVVVLGSDYWEGFRHFLHETMVRAGTIDESDLDLVFYTDDPKQAAEHICRRVLPSR